MKEVKPDNKWTEELTAELVSDDKLLRAVEKLTEATLVNTSLLMRLYDIQMALLTMTNNAMANKIYEEHEQGLHSNPGIFIPVIGEEDEDGNSV